MQRVDRRRAGRSRYRPKSGVARDVYAFGVSPDALRGLLDVATGWRRVNAPKPVSCLLGAAVEQQTGFSMSYETVAYHTLKASVVNYRDTAVHRLTQPDSHLLTAAYP